MCLDKTLVAFKAMPHDDFRFTLKATDKRYHLSIMMSFLAQYIGTFCLQGLRLMDFFSLRSGHLNAYLDIVQEVSHAAIHRIHFT